MEILKPSGYQNRHGTKVIENQSRQGTKVVWVPRSSRYQSRRCTMKNHSVLASYFFQLSKMVFWNTLRSFWPVVKSLINFETRRAVFCLHYFMLEAKNILKSEKTTHTFGTARTRDFSLCWPQLTDEAAPCSVTKHSVYLIQIIVQCRQF